MLAGVWTIILLTTSTNLWISVDNKRACTVQSDHVVRVLALVCH